MNAGLAGIAAAPNSPQAAVALELGRAFVDAVAGRDYGRLVSLFAPDVRFRALVPRAVREAATATGASDWIRTWFGDADSVRLLDSSVGMLADRLHVAYRMEVHEGGVRSVVEQQVFATETAGRLTDVALVCSGIRPVTPGTEAETTTSASPGRLP